MKQSNQAGNITQSLLHMGARIGDLMEVTEKAMDPNSPGGSTISKQEKDKIYKAIKEVEDKIASLKLSIKWKNFIKFQYKSRKIPTDSCTDSRYN